MQQFDAQAHHKAGKHRPAKFRRPGLGQREQESERQSHDDVQHHLPKKIPSPHGNINKWHQIHRLIGMVQYEWDGCDHRHHSKIEYQREVYIHEGVDKQAVSALGPPLPEKDDSIQESQHCKIYEIFYQVLHCITSFRLLPYSNRDLLVSNSQSV